VPYEVNSRQETSNSERNAFGKKELFCEILEKKSINDSPSSDSFKEFLSISKRAINFV